MNFRLLFSMNNHKGYGDWSRDVRDLAGVVDYEVIYVGSTKCGVVEVTENTRDTVQRIIGKKNGYKFISSRKAN